MNLHKFYLQQNFDMLDDTEKKFDFIPDMTSQAAAKSLDKICRIKTEQISDLRSVNADTSLSEKRLREYRDYALKHL